MQSAFQKPHDELVRFAVPFDSFTIEDFNGNAVEYDNFRPTMLVNANKAETRIQNNVQMKVNFGSELVKVFHVKK